MRNLLLSSDDVGISDVDNCNDYKEVRLLVKKED